MALLQPDRYFSLITHIDIGRDLLGRGLTCALLDIDNTIRPRGSSGLPRDVGVWLGCARDAGVSICLVSNNWHRNVHEFAAELDLPIVAKALKPLPHGFLMALGKVGKRRSEAVVIGDQLLTDVAGAHIAGMRAYMLQPLVEQDLPHTLLLRNFEHMILGGRQPESAPTSFQACAEDGAARTGDRRATAAQEGR